MNAIQENDYARTWRRLGEALPQPRAILAVSAHWMTPGIGVTAMELPPTIHDFGGFPEALHAVEYPAPGSPTLAKRVRALLEPLPVTLDHTWGLDHGTWGILVHMYPDANIPVVQLSLDLSEPASFHYALGRRLAPLREEGILIFASGNVVHNLGLLQWDECAAAPDWANRVEARIKEALLAGNHAALIDYPRLDPQIELAIPTPEHYLPLLYVLGAQHHDDAVTFPNEGVTLGSISMLSVRIG